MQTVALTIYKNPSRILISDPSPQASIEIDTYIILCPGIGR